MNFLCLVNIILAVAHYPIYIVDLKNGDRLWYFHYWIFILNAFSGFYGLFDYFGIWGS